ALFSIKGRQLGHGEPIRVKTGERVLFHVINGSATEIRSLALPGHRFQVVALDGDPAPNPAQVDVLWLGTAEGVAGGGWSNIPAARPRPKGRRRPPHAGTIACSGGRARRPPPPTRPST